MERGLDLGCCSVGGGWVRLAFGWGWLGLIEVVARGLLFGGQIVFACKR